MKRIAIAGTHGVGKTSLAHALIDSLPDLRVTLNSQIARTLIKKGYPLGREATPESYIQYVISQLQAEQLSEKCDLFISDRTLLDPLAYAIVNRDFSGSNVPESIIELLKSIWLLELQQYDLYVFVPIEFDMRSDGVRPEGERYRRKVEDQILVLLNKYGVNYLTVSGTLNERNGQVLRAIGKGQLDEKSECHRLGWNGCQGQNKT